MKHWNIKQMAATAAELGSPEIDLVRAIALIPVAPWAEVQDLFMGTQRIRSRDGLGEVLAYWLTDDPPIGEERFTAEIRARWGALADRAARHRRPTFDPFESVLIVPDALIEEADRESLVKVWPSARSRSNGVVFYGLHPMTSPELDELGFEDKT